MFQSQLVVRMYFKLQHWRLHCILPLHKGLKITQVRGSGFRMQLISITVLVSFLL